jgi:hypothetical protein
MTGEGRRWTLWLAIVATALLSAVLTLAIDRGLDAMSQPEPTPVPTATAAVALQPVIVQLPTAVSEPEPPPRGEDETRQALRRLEQRAAEQQSTTFVIKAVWQISFAMEALAANDMARADRELVAAKASLDDAFTLVPEDLKPQIDTERLGVSRIRGDLMVNPRGLDDELSQMRDRLLSLINTRQP